VSHPAVAVGQQIQLSTEFASDIQYLVSCVMYGCNSIHPNSEVKSLFPVGESLSLISSNQHRIQTCAHILSSPSEPIPCNGAESQVTANAQVPNNIRTYASRPKKPDFLTRANGCNEVFS